MSFRANSAHFTPSNPPGMPRLPARDSPAYQSAKRFKRGICLGEYLEFPSEWNSVVCTTGEFALMRAEGFDHVRVPVYWTETVGDAPDYQLSKEIFLRVDYVVANALANNMTVIVNVHQLKELIADPPSQTEKFLAVWRQIAVHYEDFPDTVAFELFNEPHDTATTELMNPINALAIAEIRRTNPKRTLFVQPGKWANADELQNLVLPPDDNLIVSTHCYKPFYFTHQSASWASDTVGILGVEFPGPPDKPLILNPVLNLNPWVIEWIQKYNTVPGDKNPCSPREFTRIFQLMRSWSDYYGYPIVLGEFGCYTAADPESRAKYHAAFRTALEAQGIGWALWNWSGNFRYWDKETKQPAPGMREAIFGK